MQHFVETYGLLFLFAIVALESSGVWVPGETALVAAAVLASQGSFAVVDVIVVAAGAAIVGDNVGYWIGRTGGRRVFVRFRLLERTLPPAERFFRRHGGKAVFFARFLAGLRVTGAWMAGISHMAWWRFLFWNALGGICWAAGVSLLAYFFGRAVADTAGRFGAIAAGALVALIVAVLVGLHLWRRRAAEA